jgi:hypothetical protein
VDGEYFLTFEMMTKSYSSSILRALNHILRLASYFGLFLSSEQVYFPLEVQVLLESSPLDLRE